MLVSENTLLFEKDVSLQRGRMGGIWHKHFPHGLTLSRRYAGEVYKKLFRKVWANTFNRVVTRVCPQTPTQQARVQGGSFD